MTLYASLHVKTAAFFFRSLKQMKPKLLRNITMNGK